MGNRAALELFDTAIDDVVTDALDAGCDPERLEEVLQTYSQDMRKLAAGD